MKENSVLGCTGRARAPPHAYGPIRCALVHCVQVVVVVAVRVVVVAAAVRAVRARVVMMIAVRVRAAASLAPRAGAIPR